MASGYCDCSGTIAVYMALPLTATPPPLTLDADGTVRVGGTRVPLDTLVVAFKEGATAEEIVQRYPSLALADAYAALAYYLQHQPAVDAYLRQREQHAAEVRREIEARFPPDGIRARLLARRERQG